MNAPERCFDFAEAVAILERTPATLDHWLCGLSEGWLTCNEGPNTFSAFDVVGHLIHGERTDWMPRLHIILEHGRERAFEPFDRFAQARESAGRTMVELLDEFAALRRANLAALGAVRLTPADLERAGMHPALGEVRLRELLATWVVHDLGHLAQIARVQSKRYAGDVGPWSAYLPVLRR